MPLVSVYKLSLSLSRSESIGDLLLRRTHPIGANTRGSVNGKQCRSSHPQSLPGTHTASEFVPGKDLQSRRGLSERIGGRGRVVVAVSSWAGKGNGGGGGGREAVGVKGRRE